MLRRYLLALLTLFSLLFSSASFALPFSVVTKAGTQLPTLVQLGSTTTAYYTVTNNNGTQRNANFVKHFPPNVSQVTGGGTYPDTCPALFNLAPRGQAGDSCTLQLTIAGPVNDQLYPDQHLFVCFPGGKTCAGTPTPLNVNLTYPVSIAITPVNASIDFQNTQQYTAIGTFADGLTINVTPLLNWISSNTAVATINSAGLATGGNNAGGTTTITANINGVTSNPASLFVAPSLKITATPSINTEVGAFYSQTNVATGGFTPYVYSISSGGTPTGTTLNSATGTVSGTPTVPGTFSYTVKVVDPQGKTVNVSTTVTIAAAVTIVGTASTIKQQGLTYSQTNVASNGVTPYVYTLTAGALPAGTLLSASTGTVSGTPTAFGGFSYTITVTDANGRTASTSSVGNIAQVLSITGSTPPNTIVGATYTQNNPAAGGTLPYTYSISAGTVPTGTALNPATGVVTGTPTAAGAFSYTVQVTDGNAATAIVTTNVTIASTMSIVATPSTFTEVGAAYSQTNVASGGVAPLTYSFTGTLPSGTSLSPTTGTVAGTPTVANTVTYTIKATDADGNFVTVPTTVTIASSPALTPTASVNTIVGGTYSQTNTVSGGTAPYSYIVSSGSVPAGTALNPSTGTVAGVPTAAATYLYTIQVTDADGLTATATSNPTISATLTLTPTASANSMFGATYSQANTAAGGVGTLTYTLASGTLPNGTSLSGSTGTVSGTPSLVGPFTYTIKVTDSKGNFATATTNVTIAPTLTLTATASTNKEVNVAYSQTNAGAGGIAPLTYSVSAGTVPTGTAINPATGTVSGTPSAQGTFTYTVKVTDADGNTATAPTTVTIAAVLAIVPTAAPNTEVGFAYSQVNTTSGGSTPYNWGVSAGGLPPGTALSPTTGNVTGTPTTAGPYNYTIQVTDQAGATANTGAIFGTISGAITLVPTASPNRMQGAAYSQVNTVNGGAAPYAYTLASGTLPLGTTLSPTTGTVSGTPTTPNTYTYSIKVTDTFGNTATAPTTVTIVAPIALAPTPSIFTEVGAVYSQVNTVSGGISPYTYGVSAGAVPAGTTLNTSTGTVSGTPTTASPPPFNYTIQVTDADGNTTTATSTGSITTTVTIAATPSTDMVVGRAYSQTNVASGGTLPYVYSLATGALPAGTSLSATTGTVSGTPTGTGGPFSYTIQVTDNDGVTATVTSSGTIAGLIALTATPSTNTGVGVPYSQLNTVSGGKGPYTYNVTAGAVPTGTSLSATTGTVSGTPTAPALPFSYTVQVIDSEGFIASATSNGTIAAALTLTSNPSASTEVGLAYSQANTPTGGVGPYTYSLLSGTLPNGTAIGPSTGIVSGTPTLSGTFNYTIKVADSDGATATAPTNVTINTAVVIIATPSSVTEANAPYSQTNAASGGTTPYTYTLASGALPGGTTLSATTGTVSGLPTAGAFTYAIKVTDHSGGVATTGNTTGTITAGVAIAATPSANTEIGVAYSQTNVASSGTPPYTYSVSSGTVPAGTSLNLSTGTVSGTPNTAATYTYTILATDNVGSTAGASTTTTIAAVVALVATASANAQVGVAYSQANTVSGGVAPYTYTISAGTPPTSTAVSPTTGTVSGTPTVANNFTYTVKVTDHDGVTATAPTSVTIAPPFMLQKESANDTPDNSTDKPSAIHGKSFVDYTFNGTSGDTVNHVRLCLATDATCDNCTNPQDISTAIDMGSHYHISNDMLTNYLMKYTSALSTASKPNSTYYIGVYVSSTGSNCATPNGEDAYCGTNNTGHKKQTHMCITANSANGSTVTSVANNGSDVYLTKPAQYVYASDASANNILQCVPNANGSFSNCSSIASIISPYATAFLTVSGTQYAYVTAGDGNVYQCLLTKDGANMFTCTPLQHGGVTPSSPQAIAFLNIDSTNQYAYLGNASGSVYKCPVSNDGSFGVCESTVMNNGSNTLTFQAHNGKQYIYGVNNTGSIEKCSVNSPTGSLANCGIQSGPSGTPTSLVFESLNGVPLAYVTSNKADGNFVYYAKLDASGNFTPWISTNNPPNAAMLTGIAFVTVNNTLYANVSTQDGTVYQCAIDHTTGSLSSCSITSKTSATLTSSVTSEYALAVK